MQRLLTPPRACASIGLFVSVLSSCSPGPRALSWTVELDSPELRGVIEIVRAEIREGGCDGPARYGSDVRPGARVPVPPVLRPGRWGFSAEALDTSCTRVAGDCDELVLPGPTSVRSLVRDLPDEPTCDASACSAGICARPDAGTRVDDAWSGTDAGLDAPTRPDAGPCPDSGGAPTSGLAPFLRCGSNFVTEGAVTDSFEIVSGSIRAIPDFFHRDGICGGCTDPVIELASGTVIRGRMAAVRDFSLLVARQMGGGNLTIEVCGRPYFGPESLSSTSPDPGFNNIPSEGTLPISDTGECEFVIRATGGVVTIRRFDVPCHPVMGPPVVSVTIDGMERSTRPGPASAVLAWSATGASQCQAMGAWSGVQRLSGSLPLLGLCAGTYSYALSCVGPGGETTVDIAELTVE